MLPGQPRSCHRKERTSLAASLKPRQLSSALPSKAATTAGRIWTERFTPPANKDKAVSYAAYTALVGLFPARQSVFTDKMMGLYGEAFAADTSAPATVGFTAAKAVLDFRHGDGSNQANGYADTSGYAPVNSWDQVS